MLLTGVGDNDRNDETIDTQDTSHDDGNNRLDNELRLEDSNRANTNTGLSSTVSGAHISENERRHDAHAAEEKRLVGISVNY